MPHCRFAALLLVMMFVPAGADAGVGDPQVRTDHPFYPGELSCSTFERLFKTQAELYKRITGRDVVSDEDKALASWYWRNITYAHGEPGPCDYFAQGAGAGPTRDYWTGLFADGFALCGTTHAQWTAEMNALLGHCRSRVTGTTGHNSFEVYLTGGAYGAGRWALLDHDLSTVVFDGEGSRLLSLEEVTQNLKMVADPKWKPLRQRGWRISGLHEGDKNVYTSFGTVEYLAGYAGPPPMMHLRRGESVRRYLEPGLEDGRTFVFWGRNYSIGGIPGPERSLTWVNQPERMHGAASAVKHKAGQARYGNAVYSYTPDFSDGSYKEAVVEEDEGGVTFEFRTPYVIAATPPNGTAWGIRDEGCSNGLIVTGELEFPIAISIDNGRTWHRVPGESSRKTLDLTDHVKGRQHYLLRFEGSPAKLGGARISWRTVCQLNPTLIPHLKEGRNQIAYHSSGQALHSVAEKVEGNAIEVTREIATPRGEAGTRLYAASWVASGNPPSGAAYRIDINGRAALKDWKIVHRAPEPGDFWSQSFNWVEQPLQGESKASVRFSNTGRRAYRHAETHIAYRIKNASPCTVTFAWMEGDGEEKTATHTYGADVNREDSGWSITAGAGSRTRWVEYRAD